jgi:hypothetical protein
MRFANRSFDAKEQKDQIWRKEETARRARSYMLPSGDIRLLSMIHMQGRKRIAVLWIYFDSHCFVPLLGIF